MFSQEWDGVLAKKHHEQKSLKYHNSGMHYSRLVGAVPDKYICLALMMPSSPSAILKPVLSEAACKIIESSSGSG
eukprot:5672599-Amphidinium_carterae.1